MQVTNALNESTTYTYDHNGNVISQTDGNGDITTYRYNAINLLIAKIDPLGENDIGKMEQYTYYANKKMATKKDRNGVITTYLYDRFGRLIKEDAGGESVSYSYDNNNNVLTTTDASGTTERRYDAKNRIITKKVPNIGESTYQYDIPIATTGEYIERTKDPLGNITEKTYDKVGRLSKVTADGKTTVYSYYVNGNRYRVTYPDGTTETYNYNKNNQVVSLVNTSKSGVNLSKYQYTYDAAGNQLTKTDNTGTTNYTYDTLNRLSRVTEPAGRITSYTYDNAGNRRSEKVQEGQIITNTMYTYNEQNRLISTLTSNGDVLRYVYDKTVT
ncbi:MAG: repeat-associated core domain protein [Anaerocolumna sp.]|jgi:YD repeat-containing protein|nr:repeat-associated core domain protein [Anaerocolumna sp.]